VYCLCTVLAEVYRDEAQRDHGGLEGVQLAAEDLVPPKVDGFREWERQSIRSQLRYERTDGRSVRLGRHARSFLDDADSKRLQIGERRSSCECLEAVGRAVVRVKRLLAACPGMRRLYIGTSPRC
jgi:hypothetical protein